MAYEDPSASASELLAEVVGLLAEQDGVRSLAELSAAVEQLPDGEGERVVKAIAGASRVRDQLAHHKLRERELQALYETARDLSSLRDVDDVLAAIVHRVRQLFGADSGYLALVDRGTGDAYMRITSGTVSQAIESVRLRPGTGIGGWIIQTGQPFSTKNYLEDRSIAHDPSVDEAVRRDGVMSIGGVPIKSGEETIGALFIADRHEQSYGTSEIALLTSLADQASIVIENARLFQRLQKTADDLRAANTELQDQGAHLQRASAAHERLMPLALGRVPPQELAEIAADIVEGAVVLLDDGGNVVAQAATESSSMLVAPLLGRGHETGEAAAEEARGTGARMIHRTEAAAEGQDVEMWTVPVRAGEESFGRLLFAVTSRLGDTDVRTLERTAQTAALLQLMERQTSLVEQQLRGDLIDDLLADREPSWEDFERRARRSGLVEFSVPQFVFVISPTGGKTRRQLLRACSDLAARSGGRGLSTEYAGNVVMLLPGTDADEVIGTVRRELPRLMGAKTTAGAAGPADSAREVRELYTEALRCHRLLLALGRTGDVAGIGDLGTLGLVLEGTSRELVLRLLDEKLGPLLRYDRDHNALLVETLEMFFAQGQNPRAAARKLHVHPNTVYQRLDRIDRVLGDAAWRVPPYTLEVQLALQLYRITSQMSLDELLDM
jgi:GAF domain-containing protein/sugar diacid utilization regulator